MHKIVFVTDGDMPEGHDFVLLQAGEDHVIFYRESAISAVMLEESWAAFRVARDMRPLRLVSAS